MNGKEFAEDMALDKWVAIMSSGKLPHIAFTDYRFPTQDMFNEFIERISEWDEVTVRAILARLLQFGCSFKNDDHIYERIFDSDNSLEMTQKRDYYRRIFNPHVNNWSNLTWVLDCLPGHPRRALDAIDAYFLAHMAALPDGRINGLSDASSIIRAKFIQPINSDRLVDSINSREFEYLVAAIFGNDGYRVEVTRASKDGGYDIKATKNNSGSTERILIECKLKKGNVGVAFARALLGLLDSEDATKGCIVAASGFTAGTKKISNKTARLDLCGPAWLSSKLNSQFGYDWANRIDVVLSSGRRAANGQGFSDQ